MTGAQLAARVREHGVLISVMDKFRGRACTHLDVDRAGIMDAAAAIREAVASI